MSQIPHDRPDEREEPQSAGAPYTGTPHGAAARAAHGTAGDAPQRYARPEGSPTSTSAVVLLILSGLGLAVFVWSGIGIVWAAPVVLAVVAMVRKDDAALSRRLVRIGWITYAVLAVLTVLAVAVTVAGFVWLFNSSSGFAENPYDRGTVAFTSAWLGAR